MSVLCGCQLNPPARLPVIAGAVLALTGCTNSVPPTYTIRSTGTGGTLNDGGYSGYKPPATYFRPAPVLPPVSTPPSSELFVPRAPAVPPTLEGVTPLRVWLRHPALPDY